MSYTVAQNTSFLTLASVFQKFVSALYFFIISGVIGDATTGVYFKVFAAIAVFTVLADFGLGSVLTREAAREPEKGLLYAQNICVLKLLFGLVAIGILLTLQQTTHYPSENSILTLVAGITLFFDSFRNIFLSILRAKQLILYEAVGMVGSQIITFIIGMIALLLHWSILWLVLAFTIGSFANTIYAYWSAKKVFKQPFKLQFNKPILYNFLKLAFPFALAGIIAQLYAYGDSFIIDRLLHNDIAQGWWGRANRIAFVFQVIPIALGSSVYPAISSWWKSAPEKISPLIFKSYQYLLLLGLPITAGVFFIGESLLARFVPTFLTSVPVLKLLILSVPFVFLNYVHGAVLNGIGKQNIQTLLMGSALIGMLGADTVLISYMGIMGPALTTVISNALVWLVGYIIVSLYISLPHRKMATMFSKIIGAVIGMSICILLLRSRISSLTVIIIAIVVYTVLVFCVGVLSKKQLQEWSQTLLKRPSL